MKDADRPLSNLIAQGWELQEYRPVQEEGTMMMHVFLLKRQREHKLLILRKKVMGEGLVAQELDI
jgi:hypothetical protein